jgi:hypothetical protein
MMKTVLVICVALLIAFFTVGVALAGKRKEKITKKEETLFGIVSCTVATPKSQTPTPGPNGALPGAAANSVPQPINTVRDCLAKGGQVVFRADGGRSDIPIENPGAVKGHEWHRVSISGYLSGTLFHIMSLRSI